jgi:uncharacterized membrane protein YjjP (DUF1212 family)
VRFFIVLLLIPEIHQNNYSQNRNHKKMKDITRKQTYSVVALVAIAAATAAGVIYISNNSKAVSNALK